MNRRQILTAIRLRRVVEVNNYDGGTYTARVVTLLSSNGVRVKVEDPKRTGHYRGQTRDTGMDALIR